MDFLNGFSRKVNKVVRGMTEKTSESATLSRVLGELNAQTAECDRLFTELGRLVYSLQNGEGDPTEIGRLCGQIEERQARIAELSEQRDALKTPRRCPACGSAQSREARYCSSCGKRLPEDGPVAASPETDEAFCPNCGAAREAGGTVCPLCGRPYAEDEAGSKPSDPVPAAPAPAIDTEEPGVGETYGE